MDNVYNTVIIGGGPAGMMAALSAAQKGKKVAILEKNGVLGRKLLITGKGRCNITHNELDIRKMAEAYGKNGQFLLSIFSKFGVKETLDFFIKNGLEVKKERGDRIFPVLDDSHAVLKILEKELKRLKVDIFFKTEVKDFTFVHNTLNEVELTNGKKLWAEKYIIATGGKSYPITGSTGSLYSILSKLGHNIIKPRPALVPLKTKEDWIHDLQGLSLKNVTLSIIKNKKKVSPHFGEMLFAHFGITGPIVLEISKEVVSLLEKNPVELSLDLKPALTEEELNARLIREFDNAKNKNFKNILHNLLPLKFIDVFIKLCNIDPNKKINIITKEERILIAKLLKDIRFTVIDSLGFDNAIITSGGVDLKEVDQKTMKSKIFDNLYFAGEILDLDGPTGGYNLQVCWSTGFIAGADC